MNCQICNAKIRKLDKWPLIVELPVKCKSCGAIYRIKRLVDLLFGFVEHILFFVAIGLSFWFLNKFLAILLIVSLFSLKVFYPLQLVKKNAVNELLKRKYKVKV
jgi:hypothetical protein